MTPPKKRGPKPKTRATLENLRELAAGKTTLAKLTAPASVKSSGPPAQVSSGGGSSLGAATAPGPDETPDPGLSTLDQIDKLIATLQARIRIADSTEVSRLDTELLRALSSRARLEAHEAAIDDKVARHPRVLRVRDAIMGALRPFPDALKAVVAAIEELGE